MPIKWSRRARTDIRNLKTYIEEDSPLYAQRFIERLMLSVEKLDNFPNIGRHVPEAEGRDDVRELFHQGYRIIYLTKPNNVFIISIVHSSRDLTNQDKQPW